MDQSQFSGALHGPPSEPLVRDRAARGSRAAAVAPGARLPGLAAIACLATAAGLFAWQLADDRLVATTAARLEAGQVLTTGQHFERDIAFATHGLADTPVHEPRPFLVRWYYRLNPLHPGAGDVLRWGSDYRGPCGSHTNVVIALLAARGIPSRPLFLCDAQQRVLHTVVEARIDGRWVVGDPTYGIVYRTRDARLATRDDIVADPARFAATVAGIAGYDPGYRFEQVARMNWRKFPPLSPFVKSALDATIGRERADAITKPLIWLRPAETYGFVATGLAALLACLAIALRVAAQASGAPRAQPAQR
jgi:hypothetical protein